MSKVAYTLTQPQYQNIRVYCDGLGLAPMSLCALRLCCVLTCVWGILGGGDVGLCYECFVMLIVYVGTVLGEGSVLVVQVTLVLG